ncbi:IucA/IucC family protein [Paenibacillus sp. JCM 10914]|uniref:IucA/IucC family protein n=1 Tax=Paenibacillus sp. JCM 10914 TaxID=1236974 RepID=UPI0003CC8969|nr:IucA/IucC family protein [Paenibacillus sp. JCM 10914]GAE06469.1 achromobactin biosynthesis protein AcsC [Paenibacillus sp. JCM 10914]
MQRWNVMEERAEAIRSDAYERAEQRVLGQLIEAVLYEEIVSTLEELPSDGTSRMVVITGRSAAGEAVLYRFNGRRSFSFDRIRIDHGSLQRVGAGGETAKAQLAQFVDEVLGQQQQGERLRRLQEELARTLLHEAESRAWRMQEGTRRTALHDEGELDGHPYHPCFKSRIGFDADDNRLYGPEFGELLQPLWIAVARSHTRLALRRGMDEEEWLRNELGERVIRRFRSELHRQDCDPDDYRFMPVHPWQWEHVVVPALHREIADGILIPLGRGDDFYRAQQSIRSLENVTNSSKATLKLSLGIINTSTPRMLAQHTVLNAALVSDWLQDLIETDFTSDSPDFVLLDEYAGISFDTNGLTPSVHERSYGALGAILRRGVEGILRSGEQALPFAALSYAEGEPAALVQQWISRYGLNEWLDELLEASVTPLIHMLYAHGIALESHAQNIVLLHHEGRPIRIALRDFHDGVRFCRERLAQPERCPSLHPEPASHLAQNRHSYMQTEDPDAVRDFLHSAFFFVGLGDLSLSLSERFGLAEKIFWAKVAGVIQRYQERHPQFATQYALYDLFSDTIRIEQLARRRLWPDAEVEPRWVPNPLHAFCLTKGERHYAK